MLLLHVHATWSNDNQSGQNDDPNTKLTIKVSRMNGKPGTSHALHDVRIGGPVSQPAKIGGGPPLDFLLAAVGLCRAVQNFHQIGGGYPCFGCFVSGSCARAVPDGRVPSLKAVCHIVDSAHDIVQKKPNLSTRLHISKAFLMKKVTMAIRIKKFGLQKIKRRSRLTPKSRRRRGAPP